MHVLIIEFRDATPYPIQLANALASFCQVTLFLPVTASGFATEVDSEKVKVEFLNLPRLRQPLANLRMIQHLRRRLRALSPDIVHITAWHIWGTPGLGVFAPFPLVATVHDVERHPGDRGSKGGYGIPAFLYPLQWRWADQIIVHAATARKLLLDQYGCQLDRVNVIPIGVYDFYHMVSEESRQEQAKRVLFFGRIWQYKGLQYLIEAEPLITRAIPDARIIIAGEGEDFTPYRQAMVNPENFDVYNHYISDEKVAELFQSASVVVLPYIEASQSGVVPIAYAFGKPVVATHVGGLPEVVEDGQTGYLVPPRDVEGLARAVIRILQDAHTRQEMERNTLEKAKNELSWTNIAKMTLDVYNTALRAT